MKERPAFENTFAENMFGETRLVAGLVQW